MRDDDEATDDEEEEDDESGGTDDVSVVDSGTTTATPLPRTTVAVGDGVGVGTAVSVLQSIAEGSCSMTTIMKVNRHYLNNIIIGKNIMERIEYISIKSV